MGGRGQLEQPLHQEGWARLPPRPDLHGHRCSAEGRAACSQPTLPRVLQDCTVLPRSSARPPQWPRTWLPSPCPPGPPAPPDARPGSWASAPGGGGHPGLRWGEFNPQPPTGSLGQQDWCSVPQHLISPKWRKVQKSWGPKPQPNPLPPTTRAQPTLSTWLHPHLAQLEDALQGTPHPVGLGLLHSLLVLQLPHKLQGLSPTFPTGVDQAWGRGLSGEPRCPRTLEGVSTQAPT